MDDKLTDGSGADTAVPRDNVIFEAGLFISAKGMDHVLIIVEKGAKVPTDYGGAIYLSIDDRSDISPIKARLSKFFTSIQ